MAAAEAIFSVVGDDLAVDRIVPSALDPRVGSRGGGGGRRGVRRLGLRVRRTARALIALLVVAHRRLQ